MNGSMSMAATFVGWLDLIVVVLTIILYSFVDYKREDIA